MVSYGFNFVQDFAPPQYHFRRDFKPTRKHNQAEDVRQISRPPVPLFAPVAKIGVFILSR